MGGTYERTEEHRRTMAESCRQGADSSHIRSKKLKHKDLVGVEHRFCDFCNDWFPVEGGHYYIRKCKTKFSERFGYDCKIMMQPKHAYYLARYRTRRLERYKKKGIQVRISLKDFLVWWRGEQARLKLKSPTVDRIKNDGHYEIGNIQLLERADNSRKGDK